MDKGRGDKIKNKPKPTISMLLVCISCQPREGMALQSFWRPVCKGYLVGVKNKMCSEMNRGEGNTINNKSKLTSATCFYIFAIRGGGEQCCKSLEVKEWEFFCCQLILVEKNVLRNGFRGIKIATWMCIHRQGSEGMELKNARDQVMRVLQWQVSMLSEKWNVFENGQGVGEYNQQWSVTIVLCFFIS